MSRFLLGFALGATAVAVPAAIALDGAAKALELSARTVMLFVKSREASRP